MMPLTPTLTFTDGRLSPSVKLMLLVVCCCAITLPLQQRVSGSTTFTLTNSCTYTVWPGVLSGGGTPLLGEGGFTLAPGQSMSLSAPPGWSGRFWGRTGCSFSSSTGQGSCASADCGGRLQCAGAGATPPATLAEFTLASSTTSPLDFYDVSLVDGYNLPMSIMPSSSACSAAGCTHDFNQNCPSELQVVDDANTNSVVACRSACEAFGTAEYCCTGAFANPSTCQPSYYSQLFKAACPRAYSYAYDDPTSTFTCTGSTSYTITFCGGTSQTSSSSNNSTSSSTNSSTGGIVAAQIWNSPEFSNAAPSILSLPLLALSIIVSACITPLLLVLY